MTQITQDNLLNAGFLLKTEVLDIKLFSLSSFLMNL